MINKTKFVFPVLALGLILSSTAFAETAPISVNTTKNVTIKACAANARSTYIAALKLAADTAKTANLEAASTKNAALKAARVDTSAQRTALKAANDTYQVALKTAKALTDKTAQMAAIKTASATYQAAIKAVKVSTGTENTAVKAANATYKAAILANAKTRDASNKAALSSFKTAEKACPKK